MPLMKRYIKFRNCNAATLSKILGTSYNVRKSIIGKLTHAVSEHGKQQYNFETLQRSEKLQSQRLVQSQKLELSPTSTSLLLDHLGIFNANGFEFEINDDGIRLKTIPMSRNTIFGKQDIDELLHILSDGGDVQGGTPRPSRVRAMFASRACRSSVMIGDILSKKDMQKLVSQLSTLNQPWNCPHGRPTMRHLVNLTSLRAKIEDYSGEEQAVQHVAHSVELIES